MDTGGVGEFSPSNTLIEKFGEKFCKGSNKKLCGDILFLICGFDEKNLNEVYQKL